MADQLQDAVLAIVEAHAETGVTMGKIVDRLVADGGQEQEVELAIWRLMQRRRLTPNGFSCRKVRKPSQSGRGAETRTYEFVLIPWSPALDAQLELDLDGPGSPSASGRAPVKDASAAKR
ncbi:hypothetical protein DB30_03950 [Enhygromyxa salina]|uniref:Uncharacterized protein n=1 Tax=Enhygromyxa salina TaxID=215803 RepID=A0A0C2D160_9BACT|nr:hypothetical protein [Enhygromyxa salina]KIG16966.1 hypothetical protein DB30_03950 [Enhygromyxa salina]